VGVPDSPRAVAEGSEIERKFLVKELPADLERFRSSDIEQGYLVVEGDREVRVRRREADTTLTVKAGGGRSRVEEEVEISAEQFQALWRLTEGRRLEKTRYEIPLDGGSVIELDVYRGSLSGLTTAEVEFDSLEASEAFSPPAWFGDEVTEDDAYRNRRLAAEGLPSGG
jgi:CYTH domain-containing protein